MSRRFFMKKRKKCLVIEKYFELNPSFLRESLEKLPAKRSNLKHKPLKWVYNFEPIILKSSQDM